MTKEANHQEPRHPIRVAAERSGLTPEVLRAWERRYQVVVPGRGDAGQRLYSDADVARLSMLARLSQNGRAVGGLVRLPDADLERLVGEHAVHNAAKPSDAEAHRLRALSAARDLDSSRLFAVLRRGVLSLGTPTFLEQVLGPMIQELGDEWHAERLGIAREHAATATVEQLVGWIIREFGLTEGAPRLLLATPAGERHGLGSMIAAAMAAHDEWNVSWLGVDLPHAQIAAAADTDGADVVALGLIKFEGREVPRAEVVDLRASLPTRVPLLLGGSGALPLNDIPGVMIARDLTHWRALLRRYAPLTNG